MKKNRGVTLTILVVTIIVALILAGVTFSTTTILLRSSKRKTIASNMYLIQAKVDSIYEEYTFGGSSDTGLLVGSEATESEVSTYYSSDTTFVYSADDLWYKWNSDILESLGFDEDMLSSGGYYIVSYVKGEVIYTAGCQDDDGNTLYTLTEVSDY